MRPLGTRILVLLLAGLMAAPAGGRVWMECAAGVTCAAPADAAAGCCAPAACDMHPAVAPVASPAQGCVIRVQPPREAVPTPFPQQVDPAERLALAVTPPVAPRVAVATVEIPHETHPPPYLLAKQGRAARPPPPRPRAPTF